MMLSQAGLYAGFLGTVTVMAGGGVRISRRIRWILRSWGNRAAGMVICHRDDLWLIRLGGSMSAHRAAAEDRRPHRCERSQNHSQWLVSRDHTLRYSDQLGGHYYFRPLSYLIQQSERKVYSSQIKRSELELVEARFFFQPPIATSHVLERRCALNRQPSSSSTCSAITKARVSCESPIG